MSNFFAALDYDSEDEGTPARPLKDTSKSVKNSAPQPTEPKGATSSSNNSKGQNTNNTKSKNGRRQAPREGKRAYDRQSGTGRGKEIKKGGGGARNWGNAKNDAKQAEGQVVEGDLNAEDEKATKIAETEEEAVDEEHETEELPAEEDKTMSYEDYMVQKSKNLSDKEAFKPFEERAVQNEFANVNAKVSTEEDFLVMGGPKKDRKREKGKEKVKVDVSFRVKSSDDNGDNRSDRRDQVYSQGARGGRGRGRGGGRSRRDGEDGRGRGRGGRRDRGRGRGGRGGRGGRSSGENKKGEINTFDTSAFPSLG